MLCLANRTPHHLLRRVVGDTSHYSTRRMTANPSRHFFTYLRHGGLLPTLARGVLAAWAMPLLLALLATATLTFAPTPAQAQAAPQRVVVLDFATAPGLDPVLGRKAADALAVELQNSRNYQVVPRQDIEALIAKTPSLTPPFDEATQARLGQTAGARSIFSGRVVSVNVMNHRAARIQVEVRQLDVTTADYINGAQVTETTINKLQDVDNDVLIDEAVDKVSSTSLRVMRQTPVPEGVVLNVTRDDIELNLGARNGVASGQHFSVLRDILNKALSSPGNDVVERVKVAEIRISRVEGDQSIATAISGRTGVRTGDRVRQIFVPNMAFPVTPNGAGTSSSLPPVQSQNGHHGGGALAAIGGVALLALLVLGAGFGGGTNSSDAGTTAPSRVTAVPLSNSLGSPSIRVNYSRGIPDILAGQSVAGYLIFRSTTAASVGELIDFVGGNATVYTDTVSSTQFQTVTVTINPASSQQGAVTVTRVVPTAPIVTTLNNNSNVITALINKTPIVPGTQYFYSVRRVTYVANPSGTTTGGGTTGGGANGGGTTTGGNTFLPRLSNFAPTSGGATPLSPLLITTTSNNLAAFTVTLTGADTTTVGTVTTVGTALFNDVDRFVVEVSTDPTFPANNRFSQVFNNPGVNVNGNIVFNLGSIRVPNFEAGATIYVRVGARNSSDSPGPTDPLTQESYIFSQATVLTGATSASRASRSRFLTEKSGSSRSSRGVGLAGAPGGGLLRSGGYTRKPGSIMR